MYISCSERTLDANGFTTKAEKDKMMGQRVGRSVTRLTQFTKRITNDTNGTAEPGNE